MSENKELYTQIQELQKRIYELDEKGAILSDTEILQELGKNVIIHPFNRLQLQPASYDITLGKFFYRFNPNCKLKYFHPENAKHDIEYWGVIPDKSKNYGALEATEIKTIEEAELYGVNIGDFAIILQPNELILGRTREFIGSKGNIRPDIGARSTMGRSGITICCCAGQGDNGYYNIWTLEIKNNLNIPNVLVVGQRVGQVKWTRTGPVQTSYNKKGNYQTEDSLEELIKNDSPLNMIPSAGAKLIREMEKYETSTIKL